MEVQLFIPCLVDQYYPSIGFKSIEILERMGCKVQYNPKQSCCGEPAITAGYMKDGLAVCTKFINDFKSDVTIVSPSASCVRFVKSLSEDLFSKESDKLHLRNVQQNIIELSVFLLNQNAQQSIGPSFPYKVVYHTNCLHAESMDTKDASLMLIKKLQGIEIIQPENTTASCGVNGAFNKEYNSITQAMLKTIIESYQACGAEYILVSDAACLMQLETFIAGQRLNLKVMHLAQVLG